MKICIKSEKSQKGWTKQGFDIEYKKGFLIKDQESGRRYYTLSFKYLFQH